MSLIVTPRVRTPSKLPPQKWLAALCDGAEGQFQSMSCARHVETSAGVPSAAGLQPGRHAIDACAMPLTNESHRGHACSSASPNRDAPASQSVSALPRAHDAA